MALARNLKKSCVPSKSKLGPFWKKHKKKLVIGLLVLSVILGAYGIVSLSHLAPDDAEKQPLVYDTGDQPLPQKVTIYINAEGGLNMRQNPDATSKILKTIPDGTRLESEEISSGWYKVAYDGQTGWVNEKYVRKSASPESSTDDNWQSYQNESYGYTLKYPTDWVKMDYGANQASGLDGYVGFGAQLADELDPSVLPPVAVKVTKDAKTLVDADYKKRTAATASTVTIDGKKGTKYVFTSSSGVQMTAYVVAGEGYTYILEESGGYADELGKVVTTIRMK